MWNVIGIGTTASSARPAGEIFLVRPSLTTHSPPLRSSRQPRQSSSSSVPDSGPFRAQRRRASRPPTSKILDRLQQFVDEVLANLDQRLARSATSHHQILAVGAHQITLDEIVLEIVGRGVSTASAASSRRGRVLRSGRDRQSSEGANQNQGEQLPHDDISYSVGHPSVAPIRESTLIDLTFHFIPMFVYDCFTLH